MTAYANTDTISKPDSDKSLRIAYSRDRRRARDNAMRWSRANGLGSSGRLLVEIIGRSSATDPWSWASTGTAAETADRLGMAKATFYRHLRILEEAGVIESSLRQSNALSVRDLLPVRTVTDVAIVSIIDNTPMPVLKCVESVRPLCLTDSHNRTVGETYPNLATSPHLSHKNGQTPVPEGVSGHQPSRARAHLELSNRRDKEQESSGRTSRRLRRRAYKSTPQKEISMNRWTDDEDGPTIGASPDRPTTQPTRTTPTSRISEAFIAAWNVTITEQRPDVQMDLPSRPWQLNGKARYMGWIKNQFLPLCKNDEELAIEIVQTYCRLVSISAVARPTLESSPPFVMIGRHFDKIRNRIHQSTARSPESQAAELAASRLKREAHMRRMGQL